ncbi:MAG TPA: ABC transporter ATP-binding protein, partial [Acidimicrobiaceae bacterium]|nr:ABC transporter ATP-binding protein [Acidimicrobiaceae bacterium]
MPGDNATFEPVSEWSTYPPVEETIRSDSTLGWLKRISPVVLTHRWRIFWSVIAAVIAMVAQILVPRVVGLAIDRALITGTSSLWLFVAILLVLGVARAAATFGYRYGLYGMAFKVEYQLRTLLFQHLGKLSFAFFDRVQSGQIISRANSDIRSVQMFMAFAPIMAVQFFSFVVAIGLMAAISVPLTTITMIALPGVFAIGQRLRKIMFPLSWVIQSRQAEIATVVDESVNGVRVVKAFAAERHQIESLAIGAQRLRWANLVQHWTRASHTPFIENLPRVALATVLLVGGLQTIDGSLTVGDLVSFNLYILLLQAPFRFIGMLLILGQRAKASAERIYEILDEPPAVDDRHDAVDLIPSGGGISFSDVSFAYGKEAVGGSQGSENAPLVLEHFNLDVSPGETIAIVGRTGSGKSTIARLLMRFYELQGGKISLDGNDIRSVTQASLRSAISLVPDEPFLFSTSVHENISYGKPNASRAEVEAAARAAQAHEFIVELEDGYDTVVGERGYDLS